jgi:dTMP kinase
MTRGRLITIEGLDGAGKTTLAESLAAALGERGVEVRALREPGGPELSERVRTLLRDPDLRVGARAEALLYAAARAQLVEEAVAPLLAGGTWVLLDRYVDSSLAYQGAGRGLGADVIRAINAFATAELEPDRTLLLALDADAGRDRLDARGEATDRLESASREFFVTVGEAYDELAASDPQRIRVIDATRPPEQVLAAALAELEDLLPGA